MSPARRAVTECWWVRSSPVTKGGADAAQAGGSLATLQWRSGDRRSGDPVVLLHGFTQNSLCWGALAGAIDTEGRALIAADLPGHGGSSEVRAGLFDTAELVAETCGPADYVGYSLGGRVLLHLAISLSRHRRARGADRSQRRDRGRRRALGAAEADELLACELDDVGDDKVALGEFLRRWLAGPLFADLDEEAACIRERMSNAGAGLASSLRLCGTGRQVPLWDRLSELSMPVLVLAGENDHRFCSLADRIAVSTGDNARAAVVREAGHACHLARPVETARMIERFWSGT